MSPVLYPVRTPPLYWVVVGALAMIGLAGAGLIIYMLGNGYVSWMMLGLCGLLVVVPIVYVATTGEYRAQGVIRLDREAVEVADARGVVLRFPVERLALVVTRVKVRYKVGGIPVATVGRGMVLDLSADGVRRRISTLTLGEPEHGECLLADLERVRRGEQPRGPAAFAAPPSPPRPRDALEAELDRELAALD